MSLPGSGLLAALRRKTQPASEPTQQQSDESSTKFSARSAAVHALEQAVAAGSSPKASSSKKAPKGCPINDPAFVYDIDAPHPGEEHPELTFRPITRVPATYQESSLRQIAVSEEFITYGLKQGHIRVLHRFSEARALLKGHTQPIADATFLTDDVLISGGQDGELYAWKLSVHDGDNAIHADQVLHAKFSPGCDESPVMLSSLHDGSGHVAVAVGNAVVILHVPITDGESPLDLEIDPLDPVPAVRMDNFPVQDAPTAIACSPDAQFLAAGSKHGRVYIAKSSAAHASLERRAHIDTGAANGPITALSWLSPSTLLVSTASGTRQTLYHSADGGASFTPGASLVFTASSGKEKACIHVASVPAQNLIILVDTPRKQVYTVHYSTISTSNEIVFDYLARFKVGLPVLNFTALWNPDASDEDGAVELNCVQTEAVQQYFLDPALCSIAGVGSGGGGDEMKKPTAAAAATTMTTTTILDSGVTLPPSPPINGAVSRAKRGSVEYGEEEEQEEECISPPSSPVAAVVQVAVPVPLPTVADVAVAQEKSQQREVEKEEMKLAPVMVPSPRTATTPAGTGAGTGTATTPPKLLTPTDLLRATGAQPKAPKVLQRPSTASAAAPPPAAATIITPPPPSTLPSHPILEPDVGVAEEVAESSGGGGGAAIANDQVSSAVAAEMATVHRKFTSHVSAMYKELLKAVRADLAAQNAANEKLLRESMAAQAAAVAAERAAVLAEERANMERLLGAISTTLNRDVPARLGEVLKAELGGVAAVLAASLTPAVQEAVAVALPRETSTAVKSALEKQLASSLQTGLQKPIQDAFRHSFSKQIVPSFENACQSMFLQIDRTFTKGFTEHVEHSKGALAEPAALASSLHESLAEASRILSASVKSAGVGGEGSGLVRSSSVVSSLRSPTAADIRADLRALVMQGRYEEAFSKALGLQDVATVGWLCAQTDAATVLSTTPPALSQMVLLSLLQQLAADTTATKGISGKLQWIREAALALNPQDPLVAPHLKSVLGQVHAALGAAIPRMTGGDVQSCKLAMHVVHSQMIS